MSVDSQFRELISPFLRKKLEELEATFGKDSAPYLSIVRQYRAHQAEKVLHESERSRHYGADLHTGHGTNQFKGLERLYRRSVVLELSTTCFTHCRWCLRSNYDRFFLRKDEIVNNINLLGSSPARDSVREILITGGEPMINIQLLDFALSCIMKSAPNIEIVRIGTRVFGHNPERVDDEVVQVLRKYKKALRIEIGTQINTPTEFWPETIDAIRRVQDQGVVVYNQHPLLKGVNDELDTLVELYDGMRRYAIEAHYLFHCVPLRGMHHHRTSVEKGLQLVRRLTAGGYFSGRSKPKYTAMTDVGKVSLYQGSVLVNDNSKRRLLLQSGYSLKERHEYNPGFLLSEAMEVDENGLLRVWYPDGEDDSFWDKNPFE